MNSFPSFFWKVDFDEEGTGEERCGIWENASRIDCWSLGRDYREITRLTITDRPRFLLSICTADSDSVPREYANEKSLARVGSFFPFVLDHCRGRGGCGGNLEEEEMSKRGRLSIDAVSISAKLSGFPLAKPNSSWKETFPFRLNSPDSFLFSGTGTYWTAKLINRGRREAITTRIRIDKDRSVVEDSRYKLELCGKNPVNK